MPVAVGVLVLLRAVIKRQSSDFAVTNKRVMMKAGVFTTRSVELLLNKIEAIAVNQSFWAGCSATATSSSPAAAARAKRSRGSRARSSSGAPCNR